MILKIITAAMMFSVIIYFGLVNFLGSQNHWPFSFEMDDSKKTIAMALSLVGLMSLALSFYFPRIFKPQNPTIEAGLQETVPLFLDFSKAGPQHVTLTIIRLALAESVAIQGLVLSFLLQSTAWIVPFGFLALFTQFLVSPFGKMIVGEKDSYEN